MSQLGFKDLLVDTSIDYARPIRVICIGAGVSGILTAARSPKEIPNIKLTIYEKNSDIGGTWFEDRCVFPSTQFALLSSPTDRRQ